MSWSHLNLSLSQAVFCFPSECLNPFIYFLLAVPLPFLLWPRKLSSQHLVSASKHVLTLTSFSLRASVLSLSHHTKFKILPPRSSWYSLSHLCWQLSCLCSACTNSPLSCQTSPLPSFSLCFWPCITLPKTIAWFLPVGFRLAPPSDNSSTNVPSKELFQLVDSAHHHCSSTFSPLLLYHPLHFFLCICLVILILQTVWSRAVHCVLTVPCELSVIGVVIQDCWMPSWWDAQSIFSLHWGWWSAESGWTLKANGSALGWLNQKKILGLTSPTTIQKHFKPLCA